MNGLQLFVHNDPDAVRIELAGSLAGAKVEAVSEAWARTALTDAWKPVIVDITFITDADEHGRALLLVMHRFGIRIIAQSPESSAIRQQIAAEPGAAFPSQAENLNPASAGNRLARVEYRGPRDPGMLEEVLQ